MMIAAHMRVPVIIKYGAASLTASAIILVSSGVMVICFLLLCK
jgi:hypothetical protein